MEERDVNRVMPAEVDEKKVFFIQPGDREKEELGEAILYNEYELYVAEKRESIQKILPQFKENAVIIICLDRDSDDWHDTLEYCRETSPDTLVYGYAYRPVAELPAVYSDSIREIFQFTKNVKQNLFHLYTAFENIGARGRRQWVRVKMTNQSLHMNLMLKGSIIRGHVLDISSNAMACSIADKVFRLRVDDRVETVIHHDGDTQLFPALFVGVRDIAPHIKIFKFNYGKNIKTKIALRKIVNQQLRDQMLALLGDI